MSLIVISVVTVIWAVCNLIGAELPDVLVRIMGVLDICAVPVFVYTSIKKKGKKSQLADSIENQEFAEVQI